MRKNSEGEIRVRCAEAERGFLADNASAIECDVRTSTTVGMAGRLDHTGMPVEIGRAHV